jgi:hypothetical protein
MFITFLFKIVQLYSKSQWMCVRIEVLMAVTMKNTAFWNILYHLIVTDISQEHTASIFWVS